MGLVGGLAGSPAQADQVKGRAEQEDAAREVHQVEGAVVAQLQRALEELYARIKSTSRTTLSLRSSMLLTWSKREAVWEPSAASILPTNSS